MQRRIVCDSQGFSCKQVMPVLGVEASQSAELHWSCMLTQTTAAVLMGCSKVDGLQQLTRFLRACRWANT